MKSIKDKARFEFPDFKLPFTTTSDPSAIYNDKSRILRFIYGRRLRICMDLAKTRYRRILDLGTGSGVCIPSLLRISDFVLGLDYHEKLTEVRDLFGCAGYKGFALTRADGYKMPLKDKSVDLIIGVSVFEHLASNDSIVSECKRVLTDDGDLIVGIPVENFITRLRHIYYRPKYKFTNDHVIHSRDILKGIGRYFYIEESRKLLPLAPFELCFYYGARFKKRID